MYQALVLDAAVKEKVQVKNLTVQEVKNGFINGNVVDQQIERARNVANEE